MTIGALPDDVLLETFELYLGKDDPNSVDGYNYDGWQTLVHVCRRWRCIVFASPRRLDLKLLCASRRSVTSKTLDIWPELPIVISARHLWPREDVTNVNAALRHRNRVCKIYYSNTLYGDSFKLLKKIVAIDEPFPALTSLKLSSFERDVVIPDSFLGGSAPRLRSLELHGIPYPSIGKLLSSATNLVELSLWNIPRSGYIAPETIVPILFTLSRLESLTLVLRDSRPGAHRASRRPPPLTRVVFLNLTSLYLNGEVEYLEDILCQIETPILDRCEFSFFNQLVFDIPLLAHFIRRTERFEGVYAARVEMYDLGVEVTFLEREEMGGNDSKALWLHIYCKPLDWQLSGVAQVLDSLLSTLPTLESLEIAEYRDDDWQDEIEVTQWQEFFHPFTSVKEITLVDEDFLGMIPALQDLTRERVTEVLPTLQNLFLPTGSLSWRPSLKEAIEQFVATRQLYGHPVTVHYQDTHTESEEVCQEADDR